jgi:hypothetical protein
MVKKFNNGVAYFITTVLALCVTVCVVAGTIAFVRWVI